MPKNAAKRLLLAALALVLCQNAGARPSSGFDVDDGTPAKPTPIQLATNSDWEKARLFPAALAVASAEAHRSAARSSSDLVVGADGVVDLALSTVIDHTLRNNLDIRVQSYAPAMSAETVESREAIFDPLLRFTLALFSTTNPTAATLDGADVLSVDRQNWDLQAQRLIPWGGTASFSFNNQRQKTNSVFSTLNPFYDSSFQVSIDQPLLRNFGKDVTSREIRIAKNDHRASSESFRQQVQATVSFAVDAYWDLYGKEQAEAVQHEALALANDLLRINRTRVEVGTMAPLEIASAEAEVARNEQLLITAAHDVNTARDRVLALMNVPIGSEVWNHTLRPVDTPVIGDGDIDQVRAISTAIERRPELRRQRFVIENQVIRLEYAANQLKPGLSLQASYGLNGLGGTSILRPDPNNPGMVEEIPGGYTDALDQLTSFDFDNWRLAAVLELPVFNGQAKAGHATALLGLSRDRDQLASLEQGVAVEVRRLARTVETSRKQIGASGVTRKLQEKRLDAEQKKFEHGLSTNFEVSQAQKDLTEARTNEVVANTAYLRSMAALERAMGTILETHDIRIDE